MVASLFVRCISFNSHEDCVSAAVRSITYCHATLAADTPVRTIVFLEPCWFLTGCGCGEAPFVAYVSSYDMLVCAVSARCYPNPLHLSIGSKYGATPYERPSVFIYRRSHNRYSQNARALTRCLGQSTLHIRSRCPAVWLMVVDMAAVPNQFYFNEASLW